jgi:hypothetical protein
VGLGIGRILAFVAIERNIGKGNNGCIRAYERLLEIGKA